MGSPPQTYPIQDQLERPLRSLRLSLTDRCNLRCDYCMPEETYNWLPRKDILTLEEHAEIASVFVKLGVTRIRLTGGEPLLRKNISVLIKLLAANSTLQDLAMTTNATLLPQYADELFQAGLKRVTVSLDSLHPDTFHKLTRRNALAETLLGIDAAVNAGFESIKLNMVVLRGVNHHEIPSMLRFASRIGAELRFIEYMDVGGANNWHAQKVVSQDEILKLVESEFGCVAQMRGAPHAPANSFILESGQPFGIIASTTKPFCASCDRSRITADGVWYHCLYSPTGINLRDRLRSSASTHELEEFITQSWKKRQSQGAQDRLNTDNRGPLLPLSQLQKNPRLEMHTRGG